MTAPSQNPSKPSKGITTSETRNARSTADPDARRPQRRRSKSAGTTWPVALLLLAVAVTAVRFIVAGALLEAPVLLQPVLEDGQYLSQLHLSNDRFAEPRLPQSSFAYAQLLRMFAGLTAGGFQAVALVQSCLEGLTALLLMLWMARRWGTLAGALAGILYAIDPLGGFFAARLQPLTWCGPLFIGALWTIDARTSWRSGPGAALLFGTLVGLGAILRPLPFLLLAGLAANAELRRRRSVSWAVLAVVPALVLTGLTLARNTQLRDGGPTWGWGTGVAVSQAFDPATGGTPRGLRPPSWQTVDQLSGSVWEQRGGEGTLYDVHRFYLSRGLTQIVERPVATIGTLLTKAAATVGAWPVPDELSPSFLFHRHVPWARYGDFSFALLLGCGLAGGVALHRARRTPSSPTTADPGTRGPTAIGTLEIGLLAVAAACLLGPTSAAARQLALPLLAGLGGVWIAGLLGRANAAAFPGNRPAPLSLGVAALGISLSVVAGLVSPTAALRNPAEEYRLSAFVYARQQKNSNSIALLEQARSADPQNQEVRVSLSRAYQQDGLISAANAELEQSLAIDATHRATLVAIAGLEQVRGNLDTAIDYMQQLIQVSPRNPLYLNELGQMLMQQMKVPEARALFVQALTIKPDYLVAQRNLETVETYLRNMENRIFPPEMTLPADHPVNRLVPVVVQLMTEENWAAADSLILEAETALPNHVLPHWLRAAYHMRRGDEARAEQELVICNRLAPGRPAIVELLVALYGRVGRPEDARKIIEESVAAAAGDPERTEQLRKIQESYLPDGAP